jgi:hypothetical protein
MITVEELISKYPKIFEDYEGNPSRVNWLDLPAGWVGIIDDLCGAIQQYCDHINHYNRSSNEEWQVRCVQMKEKFGNLRFYVNDADPLVEGMINLACYQCDLKCQDCGSRKDIVVTAGWIRHLCKNCYENNYLPRGVELIKQKTKEK